MWVTGSSTGSLKLTSWTPSDGEDQHWSLLWNAPQTEPLPSTGWFMAAHWCAQRANSSGTKQFLNAMSDKPSLELKTIFKDPWQTEFWPLCVLFVVLSEVWTWLHVHKRLMISLLWGVGLPFTLQMAPLRLLQSVPPHEPAQPPTATAAASSMETTETTETTTAQASTEDEKTDLDQMAKKRLPAPVKDKGKSSAKFPAHKREKTSPSGLGLRAEPSGETAESAQFADRHDGLRDHA